MSQGATYSLNSAIRITNSTSCQSWLRTWCSRRVTVIFAWGGAASAIAAKAATAQTPIVFVNGQDPVAMGFVPSLARPAGNVTGVSFMAAELGPKRLGLLKELAPNARRFALLVDPNSPQTNAIVSESQAAAASLGLMIEVFGASNSREIDAAFPELINKGSEALVIGSSVLFTTRRVQLVTLATSYRIPTIYYERAAAEIGGLMSYALVRPKRCTKAAFMLVACSRAKSQPIFQ